MRCTYERGVKGKRVFWEGLQLFILLVEAQVMVINLATAARKKFETEMQEKFKENQGMLDNVGKAIEGCEDASEGRK